MEILWLEEKEKSKLLKISVFFFFEGYKKEMNRQRKRGKRHKQEEDEIHTGRKQNQHTQVWYF